MSDQAKKKSVRNRIGDTIFYTALFVTVSLIGMVMYRFVAEKLQPFGDLIANKGYNRFDREHHLPHGYKSRMERQLTRLQKAILIYCQAHKGQFLPMQEMRQTQTSLHSYLKDAKNYINPATKRPFMPNAALNGKRYRDIKTPDKTLLFSDPNPPETYQEVYFVTVSGKVGHVPLKDWETTKRALNAAP